MNTTLLFLGLSASLEVQLAHSHIVVVAHAYVRAQRSQPAGDAAMHVNQCMWFLLHITQLLTLHLVV